ncbi:histidinol-phosphate transaminase [Candidatus Woesearchaeota archaeon CG10_big_fil_rev_8_21_14_0_10_34_8]|nr:MAG: histidinol-phosphate transaminase [Candidatus Woesearchaeota archaeon CG10_big_fil_rev_8_21_14_0_10_34_8]
MIKPKKELFLVKPYKPPLKNRKGKICLDFNENTSGPSDKVLDAVRNIDNNNLSMYPDYSELKKKLSVFLGFKDEELLITNGIDESIMLLTFAYLNKGDEVILPVPTFSLYNLYCSILGAKITKVSYNEDLSFPTDEVINSITKKTKIIVLVSPNNPTGTVISERDIMKILDKAKENDVLVLLDEAYYQYNGKTYKEMVKKYKNLVVMQTFSKAYGLAGLRVGYSIADKDIIATLEKLRPPYNINIAAIYAAIAALEDQEYVESYLKEVRQAKKEVYDALGDLGIKTYPTGANFFIAYLGEKKDLVLDGLRKRGVLLRDIDDYNLLNGCVRIGIGNIEQTKILISALRKIIQQ